MRFQLIGVNHKSAPLELRERLAIPESRMPDTCRDLNAYPGIEEGMVISTCNRVEIVAHTTNGHADLRGFLHDHFHLTADELDAHLYEFREKDAVRHLFRVASSLDSMVVGEAQILGQVKEAYATARAIGAVRGQLDQLFSRAFAVAKRVRTETAVGSSSVSIASVAVELAKKIFGTLEGKTVFIIGAGKMSELAARHLMAHGCASIFVANRTYERAIGLAQKFNGQAIKFDDLYNTRFSAANTANSSSRAARTARCFSSTSPFPATFRPRWASSTASSPTTSTTCSKPSAATSPTAARKPSWPKRSSPAKSSVSKPAFIPSMWCPRSCRCKIIWKRFAKRKSIVSVAVWDT